MTLNDIIIDIASAPILDVNEELKTDSKDKDYNWSYDANGSPIEEEVNE